MQIHQDRKQFLDDRRYLLSLMVKLSRVLDQNLSDLSEVLMMRFCQTLVDYLSKGHFQVFPDECSRSLEYAAIESITSRAMAFNDRFKQSTRFAIGEARAALDELAESMETRFELEDRLLFAAAEAEPA